MKKDKTQNNLEGGVVKRNLLLYRGLNYPNFLQEAKVLGVSRKIPFNQLANLEWNQEVLVATFHTYGKHDESSEVKKDGSLRWPNGKPLKIGEARIECSFSIKELLIQV